MAYPQLASSDTTSFAAQVPIFAGSAEVTTNRAQGGTNVNLPFLAVIALLADKIVQWNPAASDGSEKAVGILAAPLNTNAGAGGTAGAWAPYYTGGDFNHEALVWPASQDTLAERRAAFAQTSTIKISTVL